MTIRKDCLVFSWRVETSPIFLSAFKRYKIDSIRTETSTVKPVKMGYGIKNTNKSESTDEGTIL